MREDVNKLYYVALCCAKAMAPVPDFVTDNDGTKHYGEKAIRELLDDWFENRETPIGLKHFWFSKWIVPISTDWLTEAGHEVQTETSGFFSNLTNDQVEFLTEKFKKLKRTLGKEGLYPKKRSKEGFFRRFLKIRESL